MGAIYYKGQKYGAMPASAANLPYEAGSQDSTKDKIDANAAAIAQKAPIDDYTVVKQTQVLLSSPINLTANTKTTLLNGVDITTLAYNALDNITGMGANYDLVGVVYLWGNNSSSIAVDILVGSGNKLTLAVYPFTSHTITGVRLLTYWKRK